jgi:hypothetical protein
VADVWVAPNFVPLFAGISDNNLNRARLLADWAVDLFARPDTSKFMED